MFSGNMAATTSASTAIPSLFTSTATTSAPLTLPISSSTPAAAPTTLATTAPLTLTAKPAEPAKTTAPSIGGDAQKKEETKSMTMSQLENFLNIWAVEVRDSEATFHNQVSEIKSWDKKLIDNSEKLLALNKSMLKLKESQATINYDLDFVACHITELNDYLTDLEKKSEENQTYSTGKIDQQRRKIYDNIINLDVEVKRIHEEINELIESMNQSSQLTESLNPVTQIGSILNSHVASLQLVDKNMEKTQVYLSELSTLKESIASGH